MQAARSLQLVSTGIFPLKYRKSVVPEEIHVKQQKLPANWYLPKNYANFHVRGGNKE